MSRILWTLVRSSFVLMLSRTWFCFRSSFVFGCSLSFSNLCSASSPLITIRLVTNVFTNTWVNTFSFARWPFLPFWFESLDICCVYCVYWCMYDGLIFFRYRVYGNQYLEEVKLFMWQYRWFYLSTRLLNILSFQCIYQDTCKSIISSSI